MSRENDSIIREVKLLSISNNFGDHRAIGFQVNLVGSADKPITEMSDQVKYYWNNGSKKNVYSHNVDLILRENMNLVFEMNCVKSKEEAIVVLNKTNQLLSDTLLDKSKSHVTDKNNSKTRKKWWSKSVLLIK